MRIRRASSRRRAGLRVARALARSELPGEQRLAAAMTDCAQTVLWAVRPCRCSSPARRIIGRVTCQDRLCGTCAADRARRLAANIEAKLKGHLEGAPGTRAVFLTLTIRNTPEISTETVTNLWLCFRALRRRAIWRGVTGSAASMEFTNRGAGWHPHIHSILTVAPGAWLPDQRAWSEAWGEITGGSVIVDIRPIRGELAAACREVAKYAAKAPELESDADILALHRAIHGRRLWATTGALRGISEDDEPAEFAASEDVTGSCPSCGETAAPVLVRWRWDWRRARYREELAPPIVATEGDKRALWGEGVDPWPPRPRPPDLPPPDPGARENALARMVFNAFGRRTRNEAPLAPVGNIMARAVEGKTADRYLGVCRGCGWSTAGSFSTPAIAESFGLTVHAC